MLRVGVIPQVTQAPGDARSQPTTTFMDAVRNSLAQRNGNIEANISRLEDFFVRFQGGVPVPPGAPEASSENKPSGVVAEVGALLNRQAYLTERLTDLIIKLNEIC